MPPFSLSPCSTNKPVGKGGRRERRRRHPEPVGAKTGSKPGLAGWLGAGVTEGLSGFEHNDFRAVLSCTRTHLNIACNSPPGVSTVFPRCGSFGQSRQLSAGQRARTAKLDVSLWSSTKPHHAVRPKACSCNDMHAFQTAKGTIVTRLPNLNLIQSKSQN